MPAILQRQGRNNTVIENSPKQKYISNNLWKRKEKKNKKNNNTGKETWQLPRINEKSEE